MKFAWFFGPLSILAIAASARAGDDTGKIVVTGKSVSKAELDDAEPRASIAKPDILSLMKTGKVACKNGTVGVTFVDGKYVSDSDTFNLNQVVARVHELKAVGKISCIRVQARTYDKNVFTQLQQLLVDKEQVSLFWHDQP